MAPNMAVVHAIIIANAHRRHEKERKEQEAREAKYRKAKEQGEICYKTSPCEWCMYCYDCSKTKANQK